MSGWALLGSLRGPQGDPGPAGRDAPQPYEYAFAVPATEWAVDLSTLPGPITSLLLFDVDGNEIDAAVHIDDTTLTVSWFYPEAGRIRLMA